MERHISAMTLQELNSDKDRLVGMDILNSGGTSTKRGAGDVSTELPVFGPVSHLIELDRLIVEM